jgi:hypothetical protein
LLTNGKASLSEYEKAFLYQMLEWDRPTKKQLNWLRDIHARVIRNGVISKI